MSWVPVSDEVQNITAGLQRLLAFPTRTTASIEKYLDPSSRYAQDRYNLLGHPNDPDQVDAHDLLAISLLGMPTPVHALGLLRDAAFVRLLSSVPAQRDLWGATDEDLDALERAYEYARALPGVGPVYASKLLARKRPRLCPIWDSVVEEFFGYPTRYWAGMRKALADQALRSVLEALKPSTWPNEMTLLRLIDIAVWMDQR